MFDTGGSEGHRHQERTYLSLVGNRRGENLSEFVDNLVDLLPFCNSKARDIIHDGCALRYGTGGKE